MQLLEVGKKKCVYAKAKRAVSQPLEWFWVWKSNEESVTKQEMARKYRSENYFVKFILNDMFFKMSRLTNSNYAYT